MLIMVNRVVSAREQRQSQDREMYTDSDEDGSGTGPAPGEITEKAVVNSESIRCYYPRKEGRPGTRITFNDGGGFAVTDTFDDLNRVLSNGGALVQATLDA